MAFEKWTQSTAPFGGVLVEADRQGGFAIRVTNTTPHWIIFRFRDSLGVVRRRDEYAPNTTRSVSLPASVRNRFTVSQITEDGSTFLRVTSADGWRISVAHLEDGRTPAEFP